LAETANRPFREAATAVLEHVPSGGRHVLEEVARLLAADVGAAQVAVCVVGEASQRTGVAVVWASDRNERYQLEWSAMNGTLAGCLEGRRSPVVHVDSTPVWLFDSTVLGTREGWAIPVAVGEQAALVCLMFDDSDCDPCQAVATVSELAEVLGDLPGLDRLA
jgi:hypothetical protein